jgi:hypothetical protein
MHPHETCHLQTGFVASVYQTANVQAPQTGFTFAFGSPLLVAATLGGSMLYNAHQQNKARMASAIQWRVANEGTIFLTDHRICLQGRAGWADVNYDDLRSFEALPDGVVVYRNQSSPIKLTTSWLEYFFVMFSWLGFSRKIPVHLDPDIAARARATGALPPDYEEQL